MKKILFQGDSITDCGRGDGLGTGYPNLIASSLGYEFPGRYEFINRGISGNRVVDLLARWKKDCLNLKPDCLSILIGVNDVWHELGEPNGVSAERYEVVYKMLLDDVKNTLPETKIIILTPYVTHGTATDDNWEYFESEVKMRSDAAARIANLYGTEIINLQELFDKKCETTDASLWTADGVHPTQAGHELIKQAWLDKFKALQ